MPIPLTPAMSEPMDMPPPHHPEPIAPAPKPPEPYKPLEEPNIFLEKPTFLPQPKPISHSPKISPSSIPNPSPSVTTTKPMEPGYPSYGSYLYNIPGYSAFQPVGYPGVVQPNQAPLLPSIPTSISSEPMSTDYLPYPPKEHSPEDKVEVKTIPDPVPITAPVDLPKAQTDFEDHFTPEIIPAAPKPEVSQAECKMSITSLAQGSGATVTIPSQLPSKDSKLKTTERFSLKTSIPISKIDLKCVNNPPDNVFQNPLPKKVPVNQIISNQKPECGPKIEIQSNIVIKPPKEHEIKEAKKSPPNNSISTLLNAAEAINKTENQFRKPEPKPEMINEIKETNAQTFASSIPNQGSRPIFNPINVDSNKVNFSNKPPDQFNEQKNQILFIQNKNSTNPKMLVTIQQPNPQVLLQRTNFESKNLQAPSRLSNQSKKCKEELVENNGTSSKVVALKRLHQENCDENDFENLITENQIYGNKIVVKEKSQGTQQEQDLKKNKIDKPVQNETKNVVLQPNFVYLSNVQFPANLMMIKNNSKVTQTSESNMKLNKITPNENKINEVSPPSSNVETNTINKPVKTQNVPVTKEIHILKSNNNVLQTLSKKNSNNDIVFQTSNQNIIMNPQIVYQMPMLVETDNKQNQQTFVNREYPKYVAQNDKEFQKPLDPPKQNDKLYIACPYQMDAKLQPKIVITNIRPKKVEEISSLDIYEKKRRLRRLKYLSNKDLKDQKTDLKKVPERIEKHDDIITPEKMPAEIYNEFTNTKVSLDDSDEDSDSDYGEDELKEYSDIISGVEDKKDEKGKVEFLSAFKLATHESYKEKELDKQERIIMRDSVASAYIAAGRLDRLTKKPEASSQDLELSPQVDAETAAPVEPEAAETLLEKQRFLSEMKLVKVSANYKDSYERAWRVILRERKRRSLLMSSRPPSKQARPSVDLVTNGQLQLLTAIKRFVNENNKLIKKRLDSNMTEQDGDSIKVLAEKNFSELNRLSILADRSVKIFSGQETRKRDLNPGFDSENIQTPENKPTESKNSSTNSSTINIPNISKIISLKSSKEKSIDGGGTSTQATSMDEPQSSAAGVQEMFTVLEGGKARDFGCQVELMPWPGFEAAMRSYREYDIARRKEIADLHRRNTALRVECAHVTRGASRDSDKARALLAERQHLAKEEQALKTSLERINAALKALRN